MRATRLGVSQDLVDKVRAIHAEGKRLSTQQEKIAELRVRRGQPITTKRQRTGQDRVVLDPTEGNPDGGAEIKNEENINELSRKTLASYIRKAFVSGRDSAFEAGMTDHKSPEFKKLIATERKRKRGIERAAGQLAKESTHMHGDVHHPDEEQGLSKYGTIRKLMTKGKHRRGADKEQGEFSPPQQGNSHIKPPMFEMVAVDEAKGTFDAFIEGVLWTDVPLEELSTLHEIGDTKKGLENLKRYVDNSMDRSYDQKKHHALKAAGKLEKRQQGIHRANKRILARMSAKNESSSLAQRLKEHADPNPVTVDEEVAELINEYYSTETFSIPGDSMARAVVYLARACDDLSSATSTSRLYDDKAGAKNIERLHDAAFDLGTKIRSAWKDQIMARRAHREKHDRN